MAEQYRLLRRRDHLFDAAKVESLLDPDFVRLRDGFEELPGTSDPEQLVTVEAREVYSFPLLTEAACDALTALAETLDVGGDRGPGFAREKVDAALDAATRASAAKAEATKQGKAVLGRVAA